MSVLRNLLLPRRGLLVPRRELLLPTRQRGSLLLTGVGPITPPPAAGAFIFDERFEGTGYEETWSEGETVGGSSSLNEDATPPTGSDASWGSQCLTATTASAEVAFVQSIAEFPDNDKFYLRYEIILTTIGIGDTQFFYTFLLNHADTDNIATVIVYNSGGTILFLGYDNRDGAGLANTWNSAVTTDTLYRVELKWDLSDDTIEWRLDGSTKDSGSLSGSATGWNVNDITAGITSKTATTTDVVSCDKITVSTTDWVGAG